MRHNFFPVAVPLFIATSLSLLLSGAVTAMAQPIPGMTEVSGQYTNAEHGVEVQFPAGWEGFEFVTDVAISVTTAPGGMMSEAPTKIMGLTIANKSEVKDPTDPSSYAQDPDSNCSDPVVNSVQVSGKTGYLITGECNQDGTVWKFKGASIQTTDSWVSLVYMAQEPGFAADEGAFNAALSSLRVDGAMDVDLSGVQTGGGTTTTAPLRSSPQTLMVGDEQINLDVRSTSTITNFNLDEPNKSILIHIVQGDQGAIEIPIGRVLEGPYVVTIDGQQITDFEVTNEGSSEAMLTASYPVDARQIIITGTNVVPEFPIGVLAVAGIVIGAIIVSSRFHNGWPTKL